MRTMFKKKKLLESGYYNVTDSVEPDNIIWENVGTTAASRWKRRLGGLAVTLCLAAVSLTVFFSTAYLERQRVNFDIAPCTETYYP